MTDRKEQIWIGAFEIFGQAMIRAFVREETKVTFEKTAITIVVPPVRKRDAAVFAPAFFAWLDGWSRILRGRAIWDWGGVSRKDDQGPIPQPIAQLEGPTPGFELAPPVSAEQFGSTIADAAEAAIIRGAARDARTIWATLDSEIRRRIERPLGMGAIQDPGNPLKGFIGNIGADALLDVYAGAISRFANMEPGLLTRLQGARNLLQSGKMSFAQGADLLEATLTYALTLDPQNPGEPRMYPPTTDGSREDWGELARNLSKTSGMIPEPHLATVRRIAKAPPPILGEALAVREYLMRVMVALELMVLIPAPAR